MKKYVLFFIAAVIICCSLQTCGRTAPSATISEKPFLRQGVALMHRYDFGVPAEGEFEDNDANRFLAFKELFFKAKTIPGAPNERAHFIIYAPQDLYALDYVMRQFGRFIPQTEDYCDSAWYAYSPLVCKTYPDCTVMTILRQCDADDCDMPEHLDIILATYSNEGRLLDGRVVARQGDGWSFDFEDNIDIFWLLVRQTIFNDSDEDYCKMTEKEYKLKDGRIIEAKHAERQVKTGY